MLSPHEFATLMLVRQAPDQLDMNRAELDALLERQLVMLEHCGKGARRAYLTGKGRTFLDALHPGDAPHRSRKTAGNGGGTGPETPSMPGGRTTDIVEPGRAG
ncbi:hypothetical protein [Paraburkholderia silvatlantica]|uniref:Preprotein translocase subunit SecA n=1 Tax=Paraburkholderia silvatlantica TaxID=321895 RepID=A0A2U1AN50_9BURK|nr:hypothetical protein [Paraburkholderia silvatlantica]MBB2926551.1 hypothetical protein [Paraburkholderia silvatlantica]PVY37808.1 hypothetical protein C7411_101425 [Paraburkholderia silvatlantica]PXW42772.1 hypothetical protein C7413_101427 [Paraburkholderia silvatlantica]PYE14891.1 hypothetical protein C7410_13662 [Paraburkholderia silvatlantica]TDR04793.1 hypothetical protein C7412_10138 [Paraburkholderia silvatlantica]